MRMRVTIGGDNPPPVEEIEVGDVDAEAIVHSIRRDTDTLKLPLSGPLPAGFPEFVYFINGAAEPALSVRLSSTARAAIQACRQWCS